MATVKRKYPKEEFTRRGDALYEEVVRPHLKAKDKGKFVALDIDSGAYEIDSDQLAAGDRLLERYPKAQIRMIRVGHDTFTGSGDG
jgi:hypothetical protein